MIQTTTDEGFMADSKITIPSMANTIIPSILPVKCLKPWRSSKDFFREWPVTGTGSACGSSKFSEEKTGKGSEEEAVILPEK